MFAGTERFRFRQFLGRGGMGAVYRVHDAELGQDVALKTLHQLGPDELYRLKSEFRSLAGMTHPNLVALHELVVDGEDCFFTMEFVDGVRFDEYARGDGPGLDLARLCEALRQLVSGLSALHAAGTVHRDIKPSNVLVERGGRVVLLDFGLAAPWVPGGRHESLGALVGTPAYMAPEQQWGRRPSPACDWYGVGVLPYESATGRLPFEGAAGEVLAAKARSVPPRPSALGAHVPEAVDTLITALLDPEPTRRPSPG